MQSADPISSPRRRWFLPFALGVVGAVLVAGRSYLQRPVFIVNSQVIVLASGAQEGSAALALSGLTTSPSSILAGVFSSRPMVQHVAQGLGISELEARTKYFVKLDSQTGILDVRIETADQERGIEVLKDSVQYGHELEMDAARTAASKRAIQLRAALELQKSRYEQTQQDFLKVVSNLKSPISGDFTDVGAVAEQLRTAESNLAEAKTRLRNFLATQNRLLNDPGIPKDLMDLPTASGAGKITASGASPALDRSGIYEELRQDAIKKEGAWRELLKTYTPGAPEVIQAHNDYLAAKTVYDRELGRMKSELNNGLVNSIQQLRGEIQVSEYQVNELKRTYTNVPREVLAISNAERELLSTAALTANVGKQYELAKLEAESERVRWTVLSQPRVDPRPINKRYARDLAAGGVAGFLLALLILKLNSRGESRS